MSLLMILAAKESDVPANQHENYFTNTDTPTLLHMYSSSTHCMQQKLTHISQGFKKERVAEPQAIKCSGLYVEPIPTMSMTQLLIIHRVCPPATIHTPSHT